MQRISFTHISLCDDVFAKTVKRNVFVVRLDVVIASVFLDVTPYSLADTYQSF